METWPEGEPLVTAVALIMCHEGNKHLPKDTFLQLGHSIRQLKDVIFLKHKMRIPPKCVNAKEPWRKLQIRNMILKIKLQQADQKTKHFWTKKRQEIIKYDNIYDKTVPTLQMLPKCYN